MKLPLEFGPVDGPYDFSVWGADGIFVCACRTEADARELVARLNGAEKLAEATMELRETLAGAMRVVLESGHDVSDRFHSEMKRLGIADGIGVRAAAALAAYRTTW